MKAGTLALIQKKASADVFKPGQYLLAGVPGSPFEGRLFFPMEINEKTVSLIDISSPYEGKIENISPALGHRNNERPIFRGGQNNSCQIFSILPKSSRSETLTSLICGNYRVCRDLRTIRQIAKNEIQDDVILAVGFSKFRSPSLTECLQTFRLVICPADPDIVFCKNGHEKWLCAIRKSPEIANVQKSGFPLVRSLRLH